MFGLSGPVKAPESLQMFVLPLIPPYDALLRCPAELDPEGDADEPGEGEPLADEEPWSPLKVDPMIRSIVPGDRPGTCCTCTELS